MRELPFLMSTRRLMKYIRTSLLFLFLISMGSYAQDKTVIVSPKEKVVVLPYKDLISEPLLIDTIQKLNSLIELKDQMIVGAENGVYLIDNKTEQVSSYFKFDIKLYKVLFNKQDSIMSFNYTNFILNKKNDKVLVITSNSIVFQIDLEKRTIDWLVKFINGIGTATYSDDGNMIAIGTGYNYKNKSSRELYASLFLIDANNGQFVDYFNEYASIKKVLFIDNDTKLLVAYDWNYTDTYLWDMKDKQKRLAQFNEVNAYLYDIVFLGDNKFITVNSAGISKWDLNNPKKKKLVYDKYNVGTERIIENRNSEGYIYNESGPYLGQSGKLVFFNKDLHVIDSLTLNTSFDDIQYSSDNNYIILNNLIEKDAAKEGFFYFNLSTRQVTKKTDRSYFNRIIVKNQLKR